LRGSSSPGWLRGPCARGLSGSTWGFGAGEGAEAAVRAGDHSLAPHHAGGPGGGQRGVTSDTYCDIIEIKKTLHGTPQPVSVAGSLPKPASLSAPSWSSMAGPFGRRRLPIGLMVPSTGVFSPIG